MKKIPIEEGYLPEALAAYLRTKKDRQTVLERRSGSSGLEKRFYDMAEAGIDMQVLSCGIMDLQEIAPPDCTKISREMNDEFADVCKKYPDKFAALAAIAPQDPEAAAGELDRAVTKLGLKGALINSHIQGEYLDEPKYEVLLEKLASLDVPIYIHPNRPSPGMIKPYLKYPILTGAFWGFAAETGLHAMRLLCGGAFDRYPNLRVILGHGGEALPYWLWRMDRHWTDWNPKDGIQPEKKPSEYILKNIFITTSGMFWPAVVQFMYHALGPERILFATDYPIEDMVPAVKSIEDTPMCDADKEKIFHKNSETLLKL